MQVFLTNTFNDVIKDFNGVYPEILNIPGNAKAAVITSDVHTIRQGRYIIFQRQLLTTVLDLIEIRVFGPKTCPEM